MKRGLIGLLLLTGCAAPYDIPTDNRSTSWLRVEPEVVIISSANLDAPDPSEFYVVKRGDTLFSIAFRFGQDPEILRRRNQVDGTLIYPGQSLRLKGEIPPLPKPPAKPTALPPRIQAVEELRIEAPKVVKQEAVKGGPNPAQIKSKEAEKVPQKKETQVPFFGGWQWPVNGPLLETYSTKNKYSRSVKLGGKVGTPVKAAATGRVVYAGDGLIGFGNLIILSHGNKYLSAYGHNQSLVVKVGDAVKAGDVIATMGSTGTDSIKLHFEIRKQGKPVNPSKLLPNRSS